MTDDTAHEPEWISLAEASQFLGISASKLLRTLHKKANTLRLARSASGLLVNAADVRREVEKQSSARTGAANKPKGGKNTAQREVHLIRRRKNVSFPLRTAVWPIPSLR